MEETGTTYYDWLKRRVEDLAHQEGDREIGECLLSAPDIFTLLVTMLKDPDFPRETQQVAASILQYFLLPTDLIPEAFHGIHGLKDDIYFSALFLKKLHSRGYSKQLARNWKSKIPLEEAISRILDCATPLVSPEIASNFEKALHHVNH